MFCSKFLESGHLFWSSNNINKRDSLNLSKPHKLFPQRRTSSSMNNSLMFIPLCNRNKSSNSQRVHKCSTDIIKLNRIREANSYLSWDNCILSIRSSISLRMNIIKECDFTVFKLCIYSITYLYDLAWSFESCSHGSLFDSGFVTVGSFEVAFVAWVYWSGFYAD